MQHLEEGTVHAWLDGALPADEAARVERHAAECAECAAMVADARGLIAGAARIVSALDDVPGGVIPKRDVAAGRKSLWRTLHLSPFRAALAATLMIGVASLITIRRQPGPSVAQRAAAVRGDSAPIVTIAPAAASPPAPVTAPTAPPASTLQDRAPSAAPRSPANSAPAPDARRQAFSPQVDRAGEQLARAESASRVAAKGSVALAPTADTTRKVAEEARLRSAAEAPRIERSAAPTAAAADLRRAAPAPVLDSTARAQMAAGVSGRPANDANPTQPLPRRALPLQSVTVTSLNQVRGPDFTGCYAIRLDSNLWPGSLPVRLALEADNVVKSVEAQDRVGGPVAGARWFSVGPTSASVILPAVGNSPQSVFVLTSGVSGLSAQATVDGRTGTARIDRLTCKR